MTLPTSNAEFLSAIIGALPPGIAPHVCGFAGNPKTVPGSEWAGWSATHGMPVDGPDANWYFTLGVYRDGRRMAANCIAINGVMLDDLTAETLAALPIRPTWAIETSPGNYQAGYAFSTPETDLPAVAALQRALIAGGLCDPGADGPAARYCRMPFAVNGKHTPPFPCRIVEWAPERRYTLAETVQGLGLVLDPPRPPREDRPSVDWLAMPEAKRAEVRADLRSALQCLDANDYAEWIADGIALSPLGDDGLTLWLEWSATSPKFDEYQAECKWAGFEADSTGYAAIFSKAQARGWINPRARQQIDPNAIAWADPAALVASLSATASLVPLLPAAPAPTLALLPPFKDVPIADLATAPSEPQLFFWGGYLPAGHVTLLGGHGGVRKSYLGLNLAAHVASALPFLGQPTRPARVLFFSAEDPASLVRRRLARICRDIDIAPAELAQGLRVLDATEPSPVLFTEHRTQGVRAGVLSATYEALARYVEANAIEVLIVDNASDTFDGDEINRASVRAFIRALALLVRQRNGAVLLLAHVDKSTSRAGKSASVESYSGSTAWHNSVRSRMFLVETGPGLYELQHQKSNLGPRHEPLAILWPGDGLPQVMQGAQGPTPADESDLRALLSLIDEYAARGEFPSAAPNGRPSIAQTFAGERTYPRHLKPAGVFAVLRDAERRGLLVREQYRKANRQQGERFAISDGGREFLSCAPSAPSVSHV